MGYRVSSRRIEANVSNQACVRRLGAWCLLLVLIALPALGWPAPARADVFPLVPDFTGSTVPAGWVLGGGAALTGNGGESHECFRFLANF